MSVTFKRLPIPKEYGNTIFDIYYSIDNNRSQVIDNFNNLTKDVKDEIKDLISRMATVKNFKSPKIKYNLHGFNYGEIKPLPHRFFFFQKCGNNYIFFEYVLKKKDSLDSDIYKRINKKKELYEKEFEKFISGH